MKAVLGNLDCLKIESVKRAGGCTSVIGDRHRMCEVLGFSVCRGKLQNLGVCTEQASVSIKNQTKATLQIPIIALQWEKAPISPSVCSQNYMWTLSSVRHGVLMKHLPQFIVPECSDLTFPLFKLLIRKGPWSLNCTPVYKENALYSSTRNISGS